MGTTRYIAWKIRKTPSRKNLQLNEVEHIQKNTWYNLLVNNYWPILSTKIENNYAKELSADLTVSQGPCFVDYATKTKTMLSKKSAQTPLKVYRASDLTGYQWTWTTSSQNGNQTLKSQSNPVVSIGGLGKLIRETFLWPSINPTAYCKNYQHHSLKRPPK